MIEFCCQAMFNEFSTANIQIDKDFSAKLSGYGCFGHISELEISNNSVVSLLNFYKIQSSFMSDLWGFVGVDVDYCLALSQASANLSVETLERGLLTPKSNVWSFGIVLLELLTGGKKLDNRYSKEERNLVEWSRPFLADDCRLSLIMDPQLKGRFPWKAARTVADIAQKCFQKEPSERPTMRTIVDHLKIIQDMKHSCRFPLQEPAAIAGKQMSRSPSLNGIITPAPRLSFSPSPPPRGPPPPPSVPAPKVLPSLPTSLPPSRVCSSILSIDELNSYESRRSSAAAAAARRASIEGF